MLAGFNYIFFADSDIVIRDILRHKFNHYDKDNSFTISDQERHLFDIEVFDFFHCIDFRSQVYSLINSDQDSSINLKEWGEFFGGKYKYDLLIITWQ